MAFVLNKLRDNIFEYSLLVLLILSFFSGVINVFAVDFDNKILNLWKELLCVVVFLGALLHRGRVKVYVYLALILFLTAALAFYGISMFFFPGIILAYQVKLDMLFVVAFFSSFIALQKMGGGAERFLKNIFYIVILGSVINALFCIFEGINPDTFLATLGVGDEDWGADSGIKVVTTLGNIRAPGLLSGFVQSGVLLFIGFLFASEEWDAKSWFGRIIKISSMLIILVGIYYTTYKNSQIGLIFYFVLKWFLIFFPRLRFFITWIFAITLWTFFALSTNGMSLYWVWESFSKKLAYNSVYLRIIFHDEIISQCLKTASKFFFGVGAGVNGTFGLDKSGFVRNSIPTDSAYIYLFSNYGIVGIGAYLAFSGYALNCAIRAKDSVGIFICIYFISIDFFFNNIFVNFPSNVIYATILAAIFVGRMGHLGFKGGSKLSSPPAVF